MGLVVALPEGIYHVELKVGSLLRLRRLLDGAVMCLPPSSLQCRLAEKKAIVLAARPGRFAAMAAPQLQAIHRRLALQH